MARRGRSIGVSMLPAQDHEVEISTVLVMLCGYH